MLVYIFGRDSIEYNIKAESLNEAWHNLLYVLNGRKRKMVDGARIVTHIDSSRKEIVWGNNNRTAVFYLENTREVTAADE